ncbi:MAG: RDD family protein [Thermoleophilia bacterium]
MVSDAVLGMAERVVRPSAGPPAPRERSPEPSPGTPPALPAPAAEGHQRGIADVAGTVVGRIVPAVIEHVDVDAIVQKVDVDGVVERVDVNRVLARVDVDGILDRVDPNPLLDRVDIDRLIERVDMGAVAREAVEGLDLGEIVRESTVGLGGDVVRDARMEGMRVDRAVEQGVDRALGREPRGAVIDAPGDATSRAGMLSRLGATVIDSVVVVLLGLLILIVIGSIRLLWTSGGFDLGFADGIPIRVGAVVLLLAYLTYGWGLDGRTVGKLLWGLRVLDEDGSDLSFRRAFVRAVLVVIFPIGLLWAAVSRTSASVQDLIVSTVVVHDWGRERTPERPGRRRGRG